MKKEFVLLTFMYFISFFCNGQTNDNYCRTWFNEIKIKCDKLGFNSVKNEIKGVINCGDEKVSEDARRWLADKEKEIKNNFVCQRTEKYHSDVVLSVAWNSSSTLFASSSYDSTILLWYPEARGYCDKLIGHSGGVNHVCFNSKNELAACSSDKLISIWEPSPILYKPIKVLEGHTKGVYYISWSHNGEYLASVSYDETVKIWDVNKETCIHTLRGGHNYGITSVSWNPKNIRHVVSGGLEGNLVVWDVESGEQIKLIKAHSHRINEVHWSPDGKKVGSCSSDGTIKIWNPSNGECIRNIEAGMRVNSISWSPDGKRIVGGLYDGTIKIWDINSGEILKTLEGHSKWVCKVSWSPDGEKIISGSQDNTVKIWGVE